MSDPIRAALERLVELEDSHSVNGADPDTTQWDNAIDDARTALAAAPPAPDPRKALAARPLLEQVARMGDRIGQHTVGEITVISDRAAAWLAENPPGQPVAIEPRGCPTPGACSCVEPPAPAPTLKDIFELCEDHQFHLGYDGADEEQSAEGLLQIILVALARWGNQPPALDPGPSDFQTFQGIALNMLESLRPIVIPEILGVLRKAIKSTGEPAPAADGEREELASALEVTGSHEIPSYEQLRRAAALLREPAPAPVPVSERPWEREGWCTDWGWCWVCVQGRWLRDYPQNYLNAACLPHWALPQPPQGGEVAE